jgi:hypothetical protein
MACLVYPGVLSLDNLEWGPIVEAKHFAIYLTLGVLIGVRRLVTRVVMARNASLAVLACAGFFIVSRFVVFESSNSPVLQIGLATAGVTGALALAIWLNRTALDGLIGFLGRYSLEIFVAHTMVSAAIRILLQDFLHVSALTPYLVFCTLAGLLIPAWSARYLQRIGAGWLFVLPDWKVSEFRLSQRPSRVCEQKEASDETPRDIRYRG